VLDANDPIFLSFIISSVFMSRDARVSLTCRPAFDTPQVLETHSNGRYGAGPISDGLATDWLPDYFDLRNETFWIIAPGSGVLLLLAVLILLSGR